MTAEGWMRDARCGRCAGRRQSLGGVRGPALPSLPGRSPRASVIINALELRMGVIGGIARLSRNGRRGWCRALLVSSGRSRFLGPKHGIESELVGSGAARALVGSLPLSGRRRRGHIASVLHVHVCAGARATEPPTIALHPAATGGGGVCAIGARRLGGARAGGGRAGVCVGDWRRAGALQMSALCS